MSELQLALEQTQLSLDTDAIKALSDKIGEARRIAVIAEGPAQPSAYNLVYFLEQGDFPVNMARSGLANRAVPVESPP